MPASPLRASVEAWMQEFQTRLCAQLEAADGGAAFRRDAWERPGGGGGVSRVLENGAILEKGGVGFSAVQGEMSDARRPKCCSCPTRAFSPRACRWCMHPRSPMVPIIHMNVRYFEAGNGEAWFGGGIDLTPIYVDEAQARWFHQTLQAACARHDATYYPRFRQGPTTTFICLTARKPAAWGAFSSTASPWAKTAGRGAFCLCAATWATFLDRLIPSSCAKMPPQPFGAARGKLANAAPLPLRRVQPGLRPWHTIRAGNRRAAPRAF